MSKPTKRVFADTYGFNSKNATHALQKAISDPKAKTIIVRDMGTPWYLNKTVFVQSNKTIIFRPGVVIQAKPGTFLDNTKSMIRAVDVENISLIGQGQGRNRAMFKMNKEEYTTLEYGHTLDLSGVTNFTVKGLRFTGAGGDGILITGAQPSAKAYSENGLIDNVISDNNRRQGLSVISAKNLVVRNSVFKGTNGTAPSAGIDLEPDVESDRLENIQLENLDLRNNNGAGLKFALSNLNEQSTPISITANTLWIENNKSGGISLLMSDSGNDPTTMPNGTIRIQNSQVLASSNTSAIEKYGAGILLQEIPGPTYDPNNLKIDFNQVSIANSENQSDFYPIQIRGFGGTDDTQEIGNVQFKNVTIRDRFRRNIIQVNHGSPKGYLNNVSGNIVGFNPTGVSVDFDPETQPQQFSLVVRDADQLGGEQLLSSGDFEQGDRGWKISPQAKLVTNKMNHSGTWLKISGSSNGVNQTITDSLIAGTDYVLSGIGELTRPNEVGKIGIRYRDKNGMVQSIESISFKDTKKFQLSLGLTTPAQFASAEVFVQKKQGAGDFWVDSLTLIEQKGGIVSSGF